MRITLVIGGLSGGGAERVCVNLANSWVERGHHVTILTFTQNFRKPSYAIDSRVQQRDLGWPRRPRQEELTPATVAPIMRGLSQACLSQELVQHITFFALLRHKILTQTPDVVVAHIDITNIRVLAAMHESNIPIIVCEHSDSTRVSIGSWVGVRAALYRRASAVVTPHPESAVWLSKYDLNVLRIANPLVAPSPMLGERNGARRRLVTLMRLSQEKRPELMVRAFASIAADFPDWEFDIYGNGSLHAWIKNLIEKLAPGRIHLRGFTDDPYGVLQNAHLYVSASWIEGFGNSIWEALACGVPVVAMEAGSTVRSLVRDGVDGLIVSEDSVSALAEALSCLMGDESRRRAFATRASEVVTRFPLEASLTAWDKLLEDVHANAAGVR
jgi:GalNAc-alpha-(1->4)-GalNAc-alpha-(1->3)-diNAcBac-PP-undecaprenol alpha-1,4-N-acetyl-D-galactosaminyltransferase